MRDFLASKYSNKKIFVTGHTGFKGAWLINVLNILGAKVYGYAQNPLTEQDLYYLIKGDSLCDSKIADIRDVSELKNYLIEIQPDYVFHLAAQPLVVHSYISPLETFEVNIMGTANVLEAMRYVSNKCQVVIITTDKVYYNHEWEYSYRENDRLGGNDPYSASKACVELVVDSYRNSFFNLKTYSDHKIAISVARAGNVIGGGDWSENRLIPDLAKGIRDNKTVIVRNPDSIRPWQHVLEPIIGYLLLGAQLEENQHLFSQAFNFGPLTMDNLTVKKLVNTFLSRWGSGEIDFSENSTPFHEAKLLKLDITKSLSLLNWSPKFNANQAIDITVDWYKAYFDNPECIAQYTKNQIMQFLSE